MSNHVLVTEIENWRRKGRGRTLQFFATDNEVQHWLNNELPVEYQPYKLVGADKVKTGRSYSEHPFVCDIEQFLDCLYEADTHRFNFWIWSQSLSPELSLESGTSLTGYLAFNGLVLVQHGSMIRPRVPRDPAISRYRAESAIGIVDTIQHRETGETLTHSAYLQIYIKLRKAIKQELVWTSIVEDSRGHKAETTLQMMTAGAVEAYAAGVPFINKPGRFIGKAHS
jgi:hypothetical protein